MRVTEKINSQILLSNMNTVGLRRSDLMKKLSTGRNIHAPSDDPEGLKKVLKFDKELKQMDRYLSNIEEARVWLNETESALSNVMDQANSAVSTALRAANDSIGEDERKNLATLIQDVYEAVVIEANRQYNDAYLFGGTVVSGSPFELSTSVEEEQFTGQSEPFQLDFTDISGSTVTVTSSDGLTAFAKDVDFTLDRETGKISRLATGSMAEGQTYLISYETKRPMNLTVNADGTDGAVRREIFHDESEQINFSGQSVFIDDNNLFQSLIDLKNGLMRNDQQAIKGSYADLKSSLDQIVRYASQAGMKYERLALSEESLKSLQINLNALKSEVQDADMAQLAIDFEKTETLYSAMLKAGARLMQQSLIDYLQ